MRVSMLASCSCPASVGKLHGNTTRRPLPSAKLSSSRNSKNPIHVVFATENSNGDSAPSTVHLVGAGPGGLDNLTVKALRVLQNADVVVHDDLGGGEADILNECKPECELIHVGKRGGDQKSWKQNDVNDLLIKLAKRGKTTVRLKGGCPSVFSRVREEMDSLKKESIPYELVAGISSSLAAPLSANVPLTEKNFGKHFAVTSAHDVLSLNFSAYEHIDTCVFLMAGKALPVIVERLIEESGKGITTPCIVVKWGCTEREEVFFGTLETIIETTSGKKLSPCVFVAGEVCAEVVGENTGSTEG